MGAGKTLVRSVNLTILPIFRHEVVKGGSCLQNNSSSMFNSSTVCHLRKELLSLLSKEGSRSRRFGQMGAALLACGRQREHTDIEPPETTHTALQCIT